MKNTSLAAGLVALATCASILLQGCTPGGGAAGVGGVAGPVDLGSFEDPIRVTATLDQARAVQQVVGLTGGTISATADDGTVFTLSIPARSLSQPTRITMTPVTRLDGLPFGDGSEVTVDLQPSGLVFTGPATLSIAPATPIPPGEQILYGYSDGRLALAEPVSGVDGIAIVVSHFSGYGAAKGLMGDVEAALQRVGGSAEERIASYMRAAMQKARQAESEGKPPVNRQVLLDPYLRQMEREVIIPRIQAASRSCAAARAAIISVLDFDRQRILLGWESSLQPDEFSNLAKILAIKCMDEEYEMCVEKHIVHRIAPAYMSMVRMFELLEIEHSAVLEPAKDKVEACLHFDLEFNLDARLDADWSALNPAPVFMRLSEATSLSTEVAFSLDGSLARPGAWYFEPSSGPMEPGKRSFQQQMPACTPQTLSHWRDTGHFLGMRFDIDPADLYEGGGGVTAIEVELGLPTPEVTLSGGSCNGVALPPVTDSVSAPAIYLKNHGHGFLRDWDIHGAEVFATTHWEYLSQEGYHTYEDSGTATLRHTPRPVSSSGGQTGPNRMRQVTPIPPRGG